MTKNSDTNFMNTLLNEDEETTSNHFPMILKLVSGEELIVSSLTKDFMGDGYVITRPYIVLRQVMNNIPHLYLSKWISYAGSEIFLLNRGTVMILGIPNKEILLHYNTCIEEEFMNAISEKINTSQISTTQH